MKFLAIDIGGSKIMTAVATISQMDGRKTCTLDRIEKRTLGPKTDIDSLLSDIRYMIPRGPELDECLAVGVNVPGLADPANGMWVYAPFSGIRDVPIAQILSKMIGGKPIAIDNDVNACAMAEKQFGICTEINDFLWITISNGIGGGLVLNGEIYRGATGNAGEIGHFVMDYIDGVKCGCGNHGCLEAEASGTGIANLFRRIIEYKNGVDSDFYKRHRNTQADGVALSARYRDPFAMRAFDIAGKFLGRAISYAVNLLNLPMVVIGGGVSDALDLLEPEMNRALAESIFHAANRNLRIEKTALGYEAALVGAATTGYLNLNNK